MNLRLLVVKLGGDVQTAVIGPPAGGSDGVPVVVLLGVQDPDPSEAAGADNVVKVVVSQSRNIVNGSDAVSATFVVVVAGQHLGFGFGS